MGVGPTRNNPGRRIFRGAEYPGQKNIPWSRIFRVAEYSGQPNISGSRIFWAAEYSGHGINLFWAKFILFLQCFRVDFVKENTRIQWHMKVRNSHDYNAWFNYMEVTRLPLILIPYFSCTEVVGVFIARICVKIVQTYE